MARLSGVLVALVVSTAVIAATPIGPLPPHIAPIPHLDVTGRSATNGAITLVVWTNIDSVYPVTWSVYGRILTHDGTLGPAFRVGGGLFPRVATNGSEFLVAYSVAGSRFQTLPFENVFVQVVHADGTLGPRKALSQSLSSRVDGVLWTGTHWLVGFGGTASQVAILDASLDVRSVALEGTEGPMLAVIGNRWWAFVSTATGVSAIEVTSTGAPGARSQLPGLALRDVVETEQGARLIVADGTSVQVVTFDGSGFSTPVTLFAASLFRDAAAWHGKLVVLRGNPNAPTIHVATVSVTGEVVDRVALSDDLDHQGYPPTLEPAAEGLVVLAAVSTNAGYASDLFAVRIASLEPPNVLGPELLSAIDISSQRDPSIASNGTAAVAFWNQTIDDLGTAGTFSRMFGADGLPRTEPVRLPFTFGPDADVVFDGDRFVLAWTRTDEVFAVSVSADGTTAGPVERLGPSLPLLGEPSIATSDEGTFIVWRGPGGMVRGTALREDASPVVPGGFELLPNLSGGQGRPEIVAIDDGFLVLWMDLGVRSATISAAGTLRTLTSIEGNAVEFTAAHSGSSMLAAWTHAEGATLFAFSGEGRPFEAFDPHWGDAWTPLAILPRGRDRYFVMLQQRDVVSTTEIEMTGAYITRVDPLRRFSPFYTFDAAVTLVEGSPLVVAREGDRLFVLTARETRRRAARH